MFQTLPEWTKISSSAWTPRHSQVSSRDKSQATIKQPYSRWSHYKTPRVENGLLPPHSSSARCRWWTNDPGKADKCKKRSVIHFVKKSSQIRKCQRPSRVCSLSTWSHMVILLCHNVKKNNIHFTLEAKSTCLLDHICDSKYLYNRHACTGLCLGATQRWYKVICCAFFLCFPVDCKSMQRWWVWWSTT